jgi:hypothetical protein
MGRTAGSRSVIARTDGGAPGDGAGAGTEPEPGTGRPSIRAREHADPAGDELLGGDAQVEEEVAFDLLRQGRRDHQDQGPRLEPERVEGVAEGQVPGDDLHGLGGGEGERAGVRGVQVVMSGEGQVEGPLVVLADLLQHVGGEVPSIEDLPRHGLLDLAHGGDAALDQ